MASYWFFPVFFMTGLIAGLVDAVAGGGGLITVPVFLSFGLPPIETLGTNKFQSSFGSASATWHYTKGGFVDLKKCRNVLIFTALGSLGGTITVQFVKGDFLRQAIIWLLFICLIYTLLKPKLGEKDIHPRMNGNFFAVIFGLGLGFYDGFFGPGTGSFWTIAFMLALGYNLTKATAHTKAANFMSNIISFFVFLVAGKINFVAGISMGLGQMVGAPIGSKLVMKNGSKFVRPIFITVVSLLLLRLLYQTYFK
jgi:uncharacterized membrane protein YfcA